MFVWEINDNVQKLSPLIRYSRFKIRGHVAPSISLLSSEASNRKQRVEHINWIYVKEHSASKFSCIWVNKYIFKKKTHLINLITSLMYNPNFIFKKINKYISSFIGKKYSSSGLLAAASFGMNYVTKITSFDHLIGWRAH